MIDFNTHFWWEFLASLVVTTASWVGFSLALRTVNAEEARIAPMSGGDDSENALDFLRETVRMAEERVKAQYEQARVLERKAILMGALCVFTVAFLLSKDLGASGAFLFEAVAILFLIAAAALCARSVNFYTYGLLGFYDPHAIPKYVQDPRSGDLAYLLRESLRENYESIALNERANDRKLTILIRAQGWWISGTSATLGALAGNSPKVALARELARGWLAE